MCNKTLIFIGVIDLYNSLDGLAEHKASLLASYGFAALALAYMGYDDLPKSPSTMEMEYFEEAVNWFSRHPKVLPHGIGVHSICFGSWIGLLMASLQSNLIKAAVAISPYITAFPIPYEYKGKVSKVIRLDDSKKISTEEGHIWRYAIPTDTEDDNVPISKYSFITPVENISCPVLLVYGTGDLISNSDFQVNLIFDRMKKCNKQHLCSILRYPDAGHVIEPPYSPLSYSSRNDLKWFMAEKYLVLGGKKEAHATAQEDSWPRIVNFLRSNLQQEKCHL